MASSSAPPCASAPARPEGTPPPVVALVVDDEVVLDRLREAVVAAGGQSAFVALTGVNQGDLSSALSRRRPPTTALRRAVGVETALVVMERGR